MAGNTEIAKAQVLIDGKEAAYELEILKKKTKELKSEMDKAFKAGDKDLWKKLKGDADDLDQSVKKVKSSAVDVTTILKNLNGTNLKNLNAAQKQITAELSKMERGTKEYVATSANLQKVEAELKKVKVEMHGVSTSGNSTFSNLASGMNKYWMVITTGLAAFTGVVLGFKKLVLDFDAYEQKVANLSALTGLVGDDLKYLSDAAKELSTSTTSAGVKIKASADDIVDGFKLMGSARPELLKNKEALAQVTESALTLAAAGELEMVPAVDAVAASMNQFNLGASESNRIINVLGAGALAGAAEIPSLTESLGNCGTVANNSNLSLEQTIGVLETLAEKQLKGEEAGTQFKSSLISMKAAGLGYTSGVFNMRDALVELKARMDSTNSAMERDKVLIDVFGKRNITVGTILTSNIERYDYFAKAVTGTNVAIEQAITNTSTNSAKLEQAKNRAHLMALELGEKLAPALTFSTNAFMYFLKAIMASIKFFNEHKTAILSVVVGLTAYGIATKVAAQWDNIHYTALIIKEKAVKAFGIATKILSGEIKIATIVQKAWNFVTSAGAGGIAALIAIVASAATALYLYTEKLTATELAQQALNDASAEAEKRMVAENYQLRQLVKIAKDEKQSKEDRLAAIKKINEISPEYLGNITLEEINTKKTTKALTDYIAELERKYKVEVLHEKIKEEQGKQIDVENSKLEDNIGFWEKAWNIIKTEGNISSQVVENVTTATNNQNESLNDSKNLVTAYEKELQKLSKTSDVLNTTTSGLTAEEIAAAAAGAEDAKSKEKLKDAYEKLNDAISENQKLQKAALAEGKTDEAKRIAEIIQVLVQQRDAVDDLATAQQKAAEKATWEPVDPETLKLLDKWADEASLASEEIKGLSKETEESLALDYKNDLEAYKAITEKKIELEKELASQKEAFVKKSIESAAELANIANNAQYDKDKEKADAKYEADKAALEKLCLSKEKYDARLAALDKKKAAEDKKLKNKQIKIEAAIALAKIGTDAAVAVAKINAIAAVLAAGVATAPLAAVALAQIPWVLGSAALEAGVVVANAAVQMKKGGATPTSVSDNTPVGTVHANEYVIPAWERRIPQVMAMESIIEAIRVNRGFTVGGATSSSTITNNNTQSMFTDPLLLEAIKEFNTNVKKGIKTVVCYTDIEEVKTKIDETRANFNG